MSSVDAFQSLRWLRNVLTVVAASRANNWPGETLTFLATAVATDLACYADRSGLLFRSSQDVADAVGASRSKVRDAIEQLICAGLVEVSDIKKQTARKSKGRDATTYQLRMVDVSALKAGDGNAAFMAPRGANNDKAIMAPMGAKNETAISAPMGATFSAPMGATKEEEPGKGAGARVNARPAPITPVSVSTSSDHSADEDGESVRALERAPTPPLADHDPFASISTAAEILGGSPVTLADLDALDREEQIAAIADDPWFQPDELAEAELADAASALADLHGEALADPDSFVSDLASGFADGDPEAGSRAATCAASLLLAAGKAGARPMWASHAAIVRSLFDAIGAPDAFAAYHSATAHAGEAIQAARRGEANTNLEEANNG